MNGNSNDNKKTEQRELKSSGEQHGPTPQAGFLSNDNTPKNDENARL